MVIIVPEYTGPSDGASSVQVEFVVKSKDKTSEPSPFIYTADENNQEIIEDNGWSM